MRFVHNAPDGAGYFEAPRVSPKLVKDKLESGEWRRGPFVWFAPGSGDVDHNGDSATIT
jgi:hypothetical protein